VVGIKVFPAVVKLPDGRVFSPAKVDTAGGLVRVWAMVGREPRLVATLDAASLQAGGTPKLLASAADGTRIERRSGCGCSHPLKRFTPPSQTPPVAELAR
jgi:hypothetical protein